MNKIYSRINWENYPSDATPLNERNLNRIDVATDEIDNRVIALDTTKLDKIMASTMIKEIEYDEDTGVFAVTYLNGATKTLDTKLEKLAINFGYDPDTQQLEILLDDGTYQYADLSALITEYEFEDTDTIAFSADVNGHISAIVKDGSITGDHLQPDYLADIQIESGKAAASEQAAKDAAKLSESWAIGGTGIRDGEDTDNSRYHSQQAKQEADRAKAEADRAAQETVDRIMTVDKVGVGKPDGTTITVAEDGTLTAVQTEGTLDYNDLDNRPQINGITLNGNKKNSDLGIPTKTSDLTNDSDFRPVIHLTQEEYNALPADKLSDDKIYLIENGQAVSGQIQAANVYYANEISGLSAENAQAAIDELTVKNAELVSQNEVLANQIAALNTDIDGALFTITNLRKQVGLTVTTTEVHYTGAFVVIPANSYYVLSAMALYYDSAADWIGIGNSNTYSPSCLENASAGRSHASCASIGYVVEETTLYIWAKYSATGGNTLLINGFCITPK